MDDRDKRILTLFSQNPEVSQQDIADDLGLSQPSVAARIRKLRRAGILATRSGLNVTRAGLHMARVDLACTNTQALFGLFRDCPFFLNGFIVSGRRNISLWFVAEDIATLEAIVDRHVRRLDWVADVEFSIVIRSERDLIHTYPVALKDRDKEGCVNHGRCEDCPSFSDGACEGCPLSSVHRGKVL